MNLSRIPDATRTAFGPGARITIEGDHVLGFSGSAPYLEFVRYHNNRFVRSGVIVANSCQPALDPTSLDALVVDQHRRVIWRMSPDGQGQRLGQASVSFPATDRSSVADGTHAVIAYDDLAVVGCGASGSMRASTSQRASVTGQKMVWRTNRSVEECRQNSRSRDPR